MATYRITLVLEGNEDVIRRSVRIILNRHGFTETPFKIVRATERDIVDKALAIADRRLGGE